MKAKRGRHGISKKEIQDGLICRHERCRPQIRSLAFAPGASPPHCLRGGGMGCTYFSRVATASARILSASPTFAT